jgi:hypothetical protein
MSTGLMSAHASETTVREVIEALAPIARLAGSPGEHEAAQWLAQRLRDAGCEVQIDEEQFLDGYAQVIGALAAIASVAGGAALLRPGRRVGGLAAGVAAAAIVDDISNGPRLFRRATAQRLTTWNVVASCGDERAARTLLVLAHHDAASTGVIFDERVQAWLADRLPGIIERIDTSPPLWWAMLAGPALVSLGAALRRRRMIFAGLAGCVTGTAVFADVHRSPVSPGANDNLSAVAALVALAERLRCEPVEGLRVLLVSCGAEEVLQGGIHAFAARHLVALDRDRTWVLNIDSVGSPKLILLEGEGPVVMEDYHDRDFRDLIAHVAQRAGVPLRRGMRSRASTDAVIPSRAGYPTATLASMDRRKLLCNYHQISDTPDHLDYVTVLQALAVTEEVARELAANPWLGRPR